MAELLNRNGALLDAVPHTMAVHGPCLLNHDLGTILRSLRLITGRQPFEEAKIVRAECKNQLKASRIPSGGERGLHTGITVDSTGSRGNYKYYYSHCNSIQRQTRQGEGDRTGR